MAAETIANSTLKTKIIVGGEEDIIDSYTEIYKTNGNDFTHGDVVTLDGETSPDIDVHNATEGVAGLLLSYANEADIKASFSKGVTFADNKLVKVLRRTGGRVKVEVILNRADSVSTEIEIGDPIYASWTDDGKVSSVNPSTSSPMIAERLYLGRSAVNVGVAITADKLIEIWY